MNTDEIYKSISSHMIKGMMVHDQLSNYYNFLGLKGYSKCHEYHFMQETKGYKKFCNYIMNHYYKLIKDDRIQNPHIIPQSWFNYQKKDVDISTKKKAIRDGIDKWLDWQNETKQLYEYVYRELINNGDVAFAIEVGKYIQDVSKQIKDAYQSILDLKSVDYDMSYVLDQQNKMQQKYIKKLRKES